MIYDIYKVLTAPPDKTLIMRTDDRDPIARKLHAIKQHALLKDYIVVTAPADGRTVDNIEVKNAQTWLGEYDQEQNF